MANITYDKVKYEHGYKLPKDIEEWRVLEDGAFVGKIYYNIKNNFWYLTKFGIKMKKEDAVKKILERK